MIEESAKSSHINLLTASSACERAVRTAEEQKTFDSFYKAYDAVRAAYMLAFLYRGEESEKGEEILTLVDSSRERCGALISQVEMDAEETACARHYLRCMDEGRAILECGLRDSKQHLGAMMLADVV